MAKNVIVNYGGSMIILLGLIAANDPSKAVQRYIFLSANDVGGHFQKEFHLAVDA